jgi:hypothetical protein
VIVMRFIGYIVLAVVFVMAFAVHQGRISSPADVVEQLANRPEVSSRFQDSELGRFDATVFLFTCIILTPLVSVALILMLAMLMMALQVTVFQMSRRVGLPDRLTSAFVSVAAVGFAWTYSEFWVPRSMRLLGTIARAWVVSTT